MEPFRRVPVRVSLFFFASYMAIFAFGCSQAPVTVFVSPQAIAIDTGGTVQFTPIATNGSGVTWSASAGTISADGVYTAPSGSQSMTVTVTAKSVVDHTKSGTAIVHVVAPGQVAATTNPQVASYTIAPAGSGNVLVQFGTSTNYGLTTWAQPIPQTGGPVGFFVAGMRGNTLYHLQGVVQFADGTQVNDVDHTFTTGSYPSANLPSLTTSTTAGMTPQSGVEVLDLFNATTSTVLTAIVTDLNGNVLWAYDPGASVPAGAGLQPIKLLPNGHFWVTFATGPNGDATSSVSQEVDLSGNILWQLTSAQLNQELAAAPTSCTECNVTILGLHHDIAILPNGHIIVLADTQQVISGTTVTGDVVIDLDQNRNPVWAWNEFNHLDTDRRPMGWPDWTHTNAVLYSADDGNLIISIRHQNWLVKINYANGSGVGNILWKLGYQGDFTLENGTDPIDWFYAQHGPSFTTSNTTGQFSLVLFDNGDDRFSATGLSCGGSGQPVCLYSTVPLLQLDESAMTATLTFHETAPAYSFFGGNAELLKNGDIEFCESASGPGTAGDIYEVTQDSPSQTIWHMHVTGQYAYRGFRLPSFYPGVQW